MKWSRSLPAAVAAMLGAAGTTTVAGTEKRFLAARAQPERDQVVASKSAEGLALEPSGWGRPGSPEVVLHTGGPLERRFDATEAAIRSFGGQSLQPTASDSVPLYDDLGDHSYAVTTRTPLAQRYFDQGLRLYYGFNHSEAIRAFQEAARLDPQCAMCYWGIALAYGPNINLPMDSMSGVAAYRAVHQAQALARGVTPKEGALIGALARRYSEAPSGERAALDSSFARSMRSVVERFPADVEARTLLPRR